MPTKNWRARSGYKASLGQKAICKNIDDNQAANQCLYFSLLSAELEGISGNKSADDIFNGFGFKENAPTIMAAGKVINPQGKGEEAAWTKGYLIALLTNNLMDKLSPKK